MDGATADPGATPAAAGEKSVLLLLGFEVTGLRSEAPSATIARVRDQRHIGRVSMPGG